MMTRQTITRQAAREYQDREGLSVRVFAQQLGMPSSNLQRRLDGATDWAPEDMDRLAALGVDLPAFGEVSA